MTDFDRVESLLRELTTIVAPSEQVKRRVKEYVDVGEYDLALEWAGIGMLDSGRAALPNELALFREIAQAMSIGPGEQEWYLAEARRRAALPPNLDL